jgi:predicted HTH domain antitoxin
MSRATESTKAARLLRTILDTTKRRDKRWALELAISLLEMRALDAQDEGEK